MELKLDLTSIPRGQRNQRLAKEVEHPPPARPKVSQRETDGNVVEFRTSGDWQPCSVKRMAAKYEELVKHMSNLPGYLQRMENRGNVQDKALNIGVLDWGRLETWRCERRHSMPTNACNTSLVSASSSSKTIVRPVEVPHGKIHVHKSGQRNPVRAGHSSSHSDAVIRNSTSTLPVQDGIPPVRWFRDTKSVGRSSKNDNFRKGKQSECDQNILAPGIEGSLSNLRRNVDACNVEATRRVQEKKGLVNDRKDSDQRTISNTGSPSSKMSNSAVHRRSKEKKNNIGGSKTEERKEVLPNSGIDISLHYKHQEEDNIVLLLPRKLSHNSHAQESRVSSDKNLTEADGTSSLHNSSHEAIPSRTETDAKLLMMKHKATGTPAPRLSNDAVHLLNPVTKASADAVVNGNVVKSTSTPDQETAEMLPKKGRHPSPSSRLGFSLGRMARSFSFKDSSAGPQLGSTYVSTKSGHIMSKSSAFAGNSDRDKVSVPNRARSSPLRRLLDPLMKSKSISSSRYSDIDNSFSGSLSSSNAKLSSVSESTEDDKHGSPSTKALLQLTMKNGISLFRFMVEHNRRTFVATKQKTTADKNDLDCNYTFYSIDEIKRKSNSWIHQSSKEKSYGHVYNIIGRMKVSSSSSFDRNGLSDLVQKEAVLYGVELTQEDKVPTKSIINSQLAAVSVKTDYSCSFGETANSNGVTVILPGAVHGMPNEGFPSSLIERWKSGGLCDCGGWDIGCKIRVLSNESKICNIPNWTSTDSLVSDCCELFVQGGVPQEKPIFSLAPIEKGEYSIEFSPSISLLQAFFISVTVVSSQELCDHAGSRTGSEQKVVQDPPNLRGERQKFCSIVTGDAPAKYASNPLLSPVGRV